MIFLAAIIAYLIGSIPSAFIIGKKFFGEDVRTKGSGNVGSTNAYRNFGKKAGAATLTVDVLKGAIATFIGFKLAGANGLAIAELFVVLGHMFSVFLGFKAGKGVATTVGGLIPVSIPYTIVLALVFAVSVYLTKIVSVSSFIMIGFLAISGYFVLGPTNLYYVVLFLCLLIVIKHRSNIKRLINGTESKIR